MKTVVRRRREYTIILLTALAMVWGGLQKSVYAQILQPPGNSASSLSAAMTMPSSSQPALSLMGGNLTSLIGSNPALSLMGFNPVLNPFISSPSMAGSPVLMSALNTSMLMSSALVSQSVAGGISPGVGMGIYPSSPYSGSVYPAGVYPGSLIGSSLPADTSGLMNFLGMGGGPYSSAGGVLGNVVMPGFAGMPISPFFPNQGTVMGSLTGLAPGLIVPPLSPFGLLAPSFSSLQMGGNPYNSVLGMLSNGMMPGTNPYNSIMALNGIMPGVNSYAAALGMSPYSAMSGVNPYSAMSGVNPYSAMAGVNPLGGGGYSYGGYSPLLGSANLAVGSTPYSSTSATAPYYGYGATYGSSAPGVVQRSASNLTPTTVPMPASSSTPTGVSPYTGPGSMAPGAYGAYGAAGLYGGGLSSGAGSPYAISLLPSLPHMNIVAGIVSGTVMDQKGNGLRGVTLESSYSGWRSDYAVSDTSGRFSVAFPPVNGCSLTISYGTSYTLYSNFPVSWSTAIKFIELPGTIKDYVTGTALSGVSIVASSNTSPSLLAQTSTDSNGGFLLFLPEGEYTIAASLSLSNISDTNLVGYPVIVKSGGNVSIDSTLNLPIYAGTVVDAVDESLTLQGAEIDITPLSSAQQLPIGNSVTTGTGGKFQIPLPKGSYQLDITKSKYQKKTMTITVNGTTENNRIELAKQELPSVQNHSPAIKKPLDGSELVVTAGDDLTFSVKAEDQENSYLYFTVTGPANWPTIPANWPTTAHVGGDKSTPKNYRYTTTLADVGEHTMQITVSDLALSTTAHIKVKVQYPVQVKLARGINLISYPAGPGSTVDSYDLLSLLGDANQVEGIALYDTSQGDGRYLQAGYGKDRKKAGAHFFINGQAGYIVYAKQSVTADLNISSGDLTSCILQLKQGPNLVGIPAVLGDTYSSYDLLRDLGQNSVGQKSVENIYHYNAKLGKYEFTYWIENRPGGSDFLIRIGEGYFIGARTDAQIRLPKLR